MKTLVWKKVVDIPNTNKIVFIKIGLFLTPPTSPSFKSLILLPDNIAKYTGKIESTQGENRESNPSINTTNTFTEPI